MAGVLSSGVNEETLSFPAEPDNKSPFIPLGLQYCKSPIERADPGIPVTSLFARSEALLGPEGATTEATLGS